ncbi:hypothetical protein KNT75_gp02 [Gordonia phage Kabluna]|uniref:Uncharacterized protein n=2 Tax=Kablunavirus TaxID=2948776 RepID=A0A2D1GCK8_9CAUD|nr:hypothetical protein KNT75_gp02 [Gordonia phage Kabluna]YP_010101126.1 hypothetical protein KNU46_gp02 [Gordonia phage NosilaM]ATN89523.1 hypothetical protein SEA_KABLUNA_2 [Gordonia phage Kabluna]QAU07245.1 hypothetical protein SEA_NOSILAM_2 [Gordonia phage NosilaM]
MILRTTTSDHEVVLRFGCDTRECPAKTKSVISDLADRAMPGPADPVPEFLATKLRQRGWSVDPIHPRARTYCPEHSIVYPDEGEIIEHREPGRPRKDDLTGETPAQIRKRMLQEQRERTEKRRATRRRQYAGKKSQNGS